MTETIQTLKKDIAVLQQKLQKLEEIEKQPRMNLQQEGEYAVVSYHDKVYYRLEGEDTFSWYIKKDRSDNHHVYYLSPTLVMVEDAETERLLEGLYYNHIQVKKEKEQRTKTSVEECYKDWWGQYPELETDSQYDDTRWQGFQAGYEFAYAISTAKEVMEKVQEEQEEDEWKSVALRFGEKLSGYLSDGYYELSPAAWFRWAVFTYDNYMKQRDKESGYTPKAQERGERVHKEMEELVRESVKWCEEHPDKDPLDWLKPQTPEQVADGLKQAFREAVKQGVVSSTKPQTLYDVIADWWDEIFMNNNEAAVTIESLVDEISLWLPTEHETNSYKWNECIRMIREKLR